MVGGSFMLLGTYEHKLDSKGRLVFPSKFREAFGEEAVASLGFAPCIAIYSMDQWERLFLSLKGAMYDKKKFQNFSRVFLATAAEITFDTAGRVLLPTHLREKTQIIQEVCVIGQNNHVEIWDKHTWASYQQEVFTNFSEIEESVKELL